MFQAIVKIVEYFLSMFAPPIAAAFKKKVGNAKSFEEFNEKTSAQTDEIAEIVDLKDEAINSLPKNLDNSQDAP